MNKLADKNKNSHKIRSWRERLATLLAREPKDREQLKEILRHAEDRNVLGTETLGMIERIFEVSEMQVREVMIPKAQMISIQKDSPLSEILPIVIESGHSRFPVIDSTGKEVVGILLAKDLVKYCFKEEPILFDIANTMRPAILTPQSKRLDILLREFRATRNHIAIVLDEYGHVAGLITIEDVLEQIVGDIEDEYDIDEKSGSIKKLDDGSYIIKATTPIEEFNAYFEAQLSDEEFDTIGGIVLQELGHLPKRGEIVKLPPFRFSVLHSDNRRIYLLEMKRMKPKK